MGLQTNNSESDEIMSEINLTPFIDIMLVLLIIFLATSSIGLESGLDFNVPTTKNSTEKINKTAVVVSVGPSGEVYIQGEKVYTENFVQELERVLKEEKTKSVVIEGDQKSRLGRTVEIMDMAKRAGALEFSLAAQEKQ